MTGDISARPRFDVWTTENGLPQNSVYSILQTRDGYLWFTTLDGLVRFDGVRFTVFYKGATKGISSNRFSTLFEDREGTLWIGTEDGGVTMHRAGTFSSFTTADGLPHNSVRAIRDDVGGGILILTNDGSVRYQQGRFLPPTPQAGEPKDQFGYRGRSGALWYVDKQGLHKIKDGNTTTYTVRDGLSSLDIYGIQQGSLEGLYGGLYESRDSCLWVAARDATLSRLKDGVVTVYKAKNGLPELKAIWEDRQGVLWLATDAGVVQFSDGKFANFSTESNLSSKFCKTFYEDREGTLWVGTLDGGINRLSRESLTVYSTPEGLLDSKVYPIYEDRVGNVWIGSNGPGLHKYRDGVFITYTSKDGLLNQLVSALTEDRQGRLWIGGFGGLSWFKDGRFTSATREVFGDRKDFASFVIWVIHEDRRGNLWYGTTHGLFKYSDKGTTGYTTKDGLASDDVKVILEDREGTLWFGTYGGLTSLASDGFTSFTERDGLASNRVRSLYEDGDGVLWIGTYDGGLSRFEGKGFTSYTTAEGLFSNGVFQILEDDRNNFWMSSNQGIYRVSRGQLNEFAEGKIRRISAVSYGKEDGLLNVECNGGRQPAGVKMRDGKLWFPTQDGIAVVNPSAIPFNPQPPPVVIESLILDREAIDFNGQVQVAPGKNNLEIHYTGLSFIKPGQVSFKYKLEGLDEDWVDAGTRRTAYYAHLPPGEYAFQVIAANSDGVWNTEGRKLQIVVHPAFWQTWWFLLLEVILVISVVLLIYYRRVSQLKKQHKAQEAFSRQLIDSQESERKRIAAELHDSLGQNLLIIKNRALLGARASVAVDHKAAREQFDEITESASQAIDEVREIAYNLRPYHLDRLGLTSTLEALAERVARVSQIAFTAEIDRIDNLLPQEAEINLYRIVQECVNNIIKHSGATEAKIVIKKEAENLFVTIQDNGQGGVLMASASAPSPNGGFGLLDIAERVRLLCGTHTIDSIAGQGTIIRARFSLPCAPKGAPKNRQDES
ncbi:MAG: histidine kinase [Acidobacteriota bacterium]|nr:histidine kinase [Acidobacteriota bacterium]